MNGNEALHYLDRLQENRMRLDLEPSRQLMAAIGYAPGQLSSVIIAGTNGKGSTCAYLTAMAKAAGIRVGTFTSPHLESVLERIAFDGEPVDLLTFAEAATKVRDTIETNRLEGTTYFEFLTAAAVEIFRRKKVGLAIFEVGLGGRLDTTNALDHLGCAITRIGFDHMNILGNTLTDIAREKAAVMRPGRFAVLASQSAEADQIIRSTAKTIGTQAIYEGVDFRAKGNQETFCYEDENFQMGPIRLGIEGKPQIHNAAVAVSTALHLQRGGFPFEDRAIETGLKNARNPGRLERLTFDGKEIWLDVAHNRDSVDTLVDFIRTHKLDPIDVVVGMLTDKEWEYALGRLKEIAGKVTYCKPDSPRAWNLGNLTPIEALSEALKTSNRVLCTGSFYVVGEIRKEIEKRKHAQ